MDPRELILQATKIAMEDEGLTQSQWSQLAGMATGGQGVSKLLSRGDCRVSTLISLLRPLGCTLAILRQDDANEGDGYAGQPDQHL